MSKLEPIECKTWEDFEEKAISLAKNPLHSALPTLFRGHSDSDWELESTLYRVLKQDFPADEYFEITQNILQPIPSFYNKEYHIDDEIKKIKEENLFFLHQYPELT